MDIDIFSFGRLADGRQYYVMELLAGMPLDRMLVERRRLAPREALAVLRPIARALDAAHAAGIAHRDLKAENIFIAEDSEGEPFPKLLDFGIAKLLGPEVVPTHRTATGAPIGTPLYMSPEQAAGKGVDHRTDIYSFGVLCYQVLTGELPFTGGGYMEILTKQVHDTATPPSQVWKELPKLVDDEVAAMMAKDPAQRPANLTIATSGLATALGISGVFDAASSARSRTPSAAPRTVDPLAETHATPGFATGERLGGTTRSRAPVAAGAGAVIVAIAAIWFLTRKPAEREPAPVATVTPSIVDAAPKAPPPAPPDATPVDAAPAPSGTVKITLKGLPAGARIADAAGKLLGAGPTIAVPRGDAKLELRITARGFEPAVVTVVPDDDQAVTPRLKHKPITKPTGSSRASSVSDEIGDL